MIRQEPRPPGSWIAALDEVRAIAQSGLHYARDPYDLHRYERLLAIAARGYADAAAMDPQDVLDRFRREIGQITPRVGVDAAIADDRLCLLLIRRHDDGLWCLPCGWAEVDESPESAIEREVLEETGLIVRARHLIGVFHRPAGRFGAAHSGYFLLYACEPIGGDARCTEEAVEFGFFDPANVTGWHRDHQSRAAAAVDFLRKQKPLLRAEG